jgi:hypothetical protein
MQKEISTKLDGMMSPINLSKQEKIKLFMAKWKNKT